MREWLDQHRTELGLNFYGVETRVPIQQAKRNVKRLPADFMFQLNEAEAEALRSQIVISVRIRLTQVARRGLGGTRAAASIRPGATDPAVT